MGFYRPDDDGDGTSSDADVEDLDALADEDGDLVDAPDLDRLDDPTDG